MGCSFQCRDEIECCSCLWTATAYCFSCQDPICSRHAHTASKSDVYNATRQELFCMPFTLTFCNICYHEKIDQCHLCFTKQVMSKNGLRCRVCDRFVCQNCHVTDICEKCIRNNHDFVDFLCGRYTVLEKYREYRSMV